MLILSGAPAASDFRLAKLLAALRGALRLDPERLDSRYLHFVDLERDLDAAEPAILDIAAALRARGAAPGRPPGRTAARRAAHRHRLALVEQGDRHRARLRPRAPCAASSAASPITSSARRRARPTTSGARSPTRSTTA